MCLLHRTKKICSSTELYVQELKRLRHIFRNNEYPDWFINNSLKIGIPIGIQLTIQNNTINNWNIINNITLLEYHFLEKHHECLRKG